MKMKIAFATATALGLLMSTAMAGDNNKTKIEQLGSDNDASVKQDGSNNIAGSRTTYNEYLKQDGNNNLLTITQTGNSNVVAGTGPANSGAFQTGNLNKLTIEQTSYGYNAYANGHRIDVIRQDSSSSATGNVGDTNTAKIVQKNTTDSIVGQGPSSGHKIGVIMQNHTVGAKNMLDIEQVGSYSGWYGGGQNNLINSVKQNGSGHQATIKQNGTGVVLSTSGNQQRGPANVVNVVDQQSNDNVANITQSGFRNYVEKVSQSGGSGNTATISLIGSHNGATITGWNQGPWGWSGVTAMGMFKADRGAALAGVATSSAIQIGTGNQISYTVDGGDSNQFGFYQYGTGNLATGITITGDANELGVNQAGDRNSLTLSAISGDENIIGLKQNGSDNVATINVSGNRNVGFNDFTGGPAGDLATSAGLTAGLLVQDGLGNSVSLTVTNGDNNVFASLQDGDTNVITATQSGSSNEAAVAQIGNGNAANVSQSGGGNSASIQQ